MDIEKAIKWQKAKKPVKDKYNHDSKRIGKANEKMDKWLKGMR